MVEVYNKRMLEDSEDLLKTTLQILRENSIPNGLDIKLKCQVLLFMLHSRPKRNIAQSELDFIDKSGSLDDFQGFFKDPSTK